MPIDYPTEELKLPAGQQIVIRTQTGMHVVTNIARAATSHFATCPQADQWRTNQGRSDR